MKDRFLKYLKKLYADPSKDELAVQHVAGGTTIAPKEDSADVPIDAIVRLAEKLMAIRSTEDNLVGLKEVVATAGKELTHLTIEAFEFDNKPSLLIHNAKPGTKHFKVIFNAHLDVVPGNDDQYLPYVKDGKLYGRGAYDMKAAAAVKILLFKKFAKTIPYPIALQLVADEELAQGMGTKGQLKEGIRGDFAIIGECSTNLDIIYENKGLIHATITTHGNAAHGAYPWKGENAIMKMNTVIRILHEHFPTPQEETFASTVNVSQIETSNDTWNLVPSDCKATLDIRVNRNDKDTILEKIRAVLPDDVTLDVAKVRSSHYTDPDNFYIRKLVDAAKETTGKDVIKRKTFGGSDTVFFSEYGCDAVEFGPVGHGPHHDSEWVEIKSLEEYYKILRAFLLSLK